MESAVDEFGSDYRFSATYFGNELGYFIDTINGTSSDAASNCFWFIFIKPPNGDEVLSPLGVSNFRIRRSGFAMVWRYMKFQGSHE